MGSKLNFKLLYHNQGNTYTTIIHEHLVFYQKEDWEDSGIVFEGGKQVREVDYNPYVLTPGEQLLRELDIQTNFHEADTVGKIDLSQQIKIGIVLTYINKEGLRASDLLPVGYIQLNPKKEIIKYKTEYQVYELKTENSYSGKSIE